MKTTDLIIVGGGPAGLCAAISGASEGLNIQLLDNGISLGGQARESSAIENYPGFPGGVTGDSLMGCFVRQALDFNTGFICPSNVARIDKEIDDNLIRITTDDYREFTAKAVLISIGLQYRFLNAGGVGPLMGRGVYYGAPSSLLHSDVPRKIAVIGGANSAGQAVVKLASTHPNNQIKLVIRKTIELQMSQYLVDRIKKLSNVEICEHCEITEISGEGALETITINENGNSKTHDMDAMFIFIGAMPRTLWINNEIKLDKDKYILTDNDLLKADPSINRPVLAFETSMEGVFAAGDVRSGSTKRVAVAAGEGASALQQIHRYLANRS